MMAGLLYLMREKNNGAMGRLREFGESVSTELHENKRSFAVYVVLWTLTVIALVRTVINGQPESSFYCILTLVLLVVPSMLQVRFGLYVPQTLEIVLMLFIFAAWILGEVGGYYTTLPFWDTLLHTANGFLCAAIGFSFVMVINNNNKGLLFELSPVFMALFAFCFSMTIAVVWEFFEFAMDQVFMGDMQKDTVIHAISSVALNPDGLQAPVAIMDIASVQVNGVELGLGGYLDIGLVDTMEDLFVNFVGALVFCTIGYLGLKGNEKNWRFVADNLTVLRKDQR